MSFLSLALADVAPPFSKELRVVSDHLPWIMLIVLLLITGIVLFCLLRRKKRRAAEKKTEGTAEREEDMP